MPDLVDAQAASGEMMEELSIIMAGIPGVVENLLKEHVPDEKGRCSGCTKPGTGIPEKPWPCSLRWFADQARSEGQRA